MGKHVVKLRKDRETILPRRATSGSAGFDVFAPNGVILPANSVTPVDLGVSVAIPDGHAALLLNRSGLHLKHRVWAATGLIDSDYRGVLTAAMRNDGNADYEIKTGDSIAQLLFVKLADVTFELGELDKTARGENGFGSTDVREENLPTEDKQ